MEFAIVLFTEENDAPAIVSTNWINYDKKTCFYPNVISEGRKNKLLISRQAPSSNWPEYPVRVLKEFAHYHAARNRLREAEDTSNLESEGECTRPHKRKMKYVRRLGEQSSSEEDEILAGTQMKIAIDSYPPPPPPTPDSSFKVRDINTSIIHKSNTQVELTAQDVPQTSSCISHSPILETPQKMILQSKMLSNKENITCISVKSPIKECNCVIKRTNIYQKSVSDVVLTEILTGIEKLNSKLDTLLIQLPDQQMQKSEECNLISSIPLGIDDFIKLNEKLSENSSFKKKLMKILMTFGGRDSKGLACNILKKLLVDDAAERYSLTGKVFKNGMLKQSFEKTEIYKLILEICVQTFNTTKETEVREAVSDWLMHAKFRKDRREKRKKISQEAALQDATQN